jgi:hypothetical protein
MKHHVAALAAGAFSLLLGASVYASTPNTTAAGSVSYEVGTGWVTDGVDEGNQNRWFAFLELAGRSYCVEGTLGPASYFPLDPNLTLYSDSAGTVVYLTNTDGAGEPPQYRGSRVCYQSPLGVGATQVRLFKVNLPITAGSGDSGFVRARVIDTTLIFPMLCMSQNYTMSIANTTTVAISATVYVSGYGASKTISSSSLPAPNQATGTGNLYQFTTDNSQHLNWQGAVYLMHSGPPGALEAWADTKDNCGATTVRMYANPR